MQIVPLSAFRDNYIWALVANGQCVVVDPGEAAPVSRFLAAEGLHLAAILITHRHNDHVGGVAELRQTWPVPVFGPAPIAVVTHAVGDADEIALPGVGGSVSVMAVPGHVEEHIAFRYGTHLFCGDTLFAAGCGRLLGSSTASDLFDSLQRIAALPDDTRVCCAHEYTMSNLRFAQAVEPRNEALAGRVAACAALREKDQPTLPSLLKEERATKPFLRASHADVRHAAEQQSGKTLKTPVEVFAALRAWKDDFKG